MKNATLLYLGYAVLSVGTLYCIVLYWVCIVLYCIVQLYSNVPNLKNAYLPTTCLLVPFFKCSCLDCRRNTLFLHFFTLIVLPYFFCVSKVTDFFSCLLFSTIVLKCNFYLYMLKGLSHEN